MDELEGEHTEHYPLSELMRRAMAQPRELAELSQLEDQGCNALVVAAHCCLVRDVREQQLPGLNSSLTHEHNNHARLSHVNDSKTCTDR